MNNVMKTIEYIGNVFEVKNDESVQTLLKNLSAELKEGESIRVSLYRTQDKVKNLELQWVVVCNMVTPVKFCPCGSVRPSGYYNYGPEDGWPHCPDCGMV